MAKFNLFSYQVYLILSIKLFENLQKQEYSKFVSYDL